MEVCRIVLLLLILTVETRGSPKSTTADLERFLQIVFERHILPLYPIAYILQAVNDRHGIPPLILDILCALCDIEKNPVKRQACLDTFGCVKVSVVSSMLTS